MGSQQTEEGTLLAKESPAQHQVASCPQHLPCLLQPAGVLTANCRCPETKAQAQVPRPPSHPPPPEGIKRPGTAPRPSPRCVRSRARGTAALGWLRLASHAAAWRPAPLPGVHTYTAQLRVEVAPAGLLAAPVQPAQPVQHLLLRRRKSAFRPASAGRSHAPRRPGAAHQDRGGAARGSASPPQRRPPAAPRRSRLGSVPRPEEPAPGRVPRPARPGSRAPNLEGEDPAQPGVLGERGGCPHRQRGLGTPRPPCFPRRGAPGDAQALGNSLSLTCTGKTLPGMGRPRTGHTRALRGTTGQ